MKVIEYYHKDSDIVAYKRIVRSNGSWYDYTYNERGQQITCKDSNGFWSECTYDKRGNQLTYKSSSGYCYERTYNEKGNRLTFKDSYGTYQIRGEFVTKEKFEQFFNPKPCLGKKVIVDGVEYVLN